MLEAVAPLGSDYVATLRKGFDSRWMDTYPRPSKQSGAHMAGTAYEVHPYVLMNTTTTTNPSARWRTNGATRCTACWPTAASLS